MGKSNHSILILDDDSAFRKLVGDLLKSRGLEIIEAASGKEACAIFDQNKPILAIVDYRLPDTDGLSWITKIKDSGNKCPVVFVSQSWCDPKTFSWLRNIVKVSLILQKPIVPELFLQQIENLIPNNLLAEASNERAAIQVRMDKLNQLKLEYAPKLSKAWEELTLTISTVQSRPNDTEAVTKAIDIAHKLAGTAGSIGFNRVGDIAGRVQNLLQRLDPSDTLQQIIWSEIFRTLAEGETAVRDSVRACEITKNQSRGLALDKILVYGKEEIHKNKFADLKTLAPIQIDILDDLAVLEQIIKTSSYDAIIFDLSMTDHNQIFRSARDIRSLPGYEFMPFGFISKSLFGFISQSLKTPAEVDLIYAGCTVLLSEVPTKTEIEQACNKLLAFRQSNKPRILAVDDDEMLTKFITGILTEEGMVVSALNNPIEIISRVEQVKPDLVLLDVIMPGLSGYDVCRKIRSDPKWKNLPVIFLTSKNDQTGRAASFHAGGSDFLSKPILAEELVLRINNQLARRKAISAPKNTNQQIGILNGEDFIHSSENLLGCAQIAGKSITFSLLSIDGFRDIGFKQGWNSAQEVLLALNKLIQCRFRAEDLRGCLGEDLFALAFPDEETNVIEMVMTKLLEEFAAMKFKDATGATFQATFNFGIAEYPSNGFDLPTLLDKANRQHLSKREEKDKVAV